MFHDCIASVLNHVKMIVILEVVCAIKLQEGVVLAQRERRLQDARDKS